MRYRWVRLDQLTFHVGSLLEIFFFKFLPNLECIKGGKSIIYQKLRIAKKKLWIQQIRSEHCRSFEINIMFQLNWTQNTCKLWTKSIVTQVRNTLIISNIFFSYGEGMGGGGKRCSGPACISLNRTEPISILRWIFFTPMLISIFYFFLYWVFIYYSNTIVIYFYAIDEESITID